MAAQRGMMTVNKLIKALLIDFLEKKEYALLRDIKNKKSELDALIKEKKTNTQKFIELRGRILEAGTGKILAELEQQIPKISRITSILKKAEEKGKISGELKSQMDLITYLFAFIVAVLAGAGERNLAWLDTQQKRALRENNFDEFSALFAEENRLCSRFDQLAEKLNLAGIAEALKKPGAKKSSWFKRMMVMGMALVILGTAGLFTSAVMKAYAKEQDPLENVVKMYLAEEILQETEEEKELETLYGINIIGDFTAGDLARFKAQLEKNHTPEEIKAYGLKTIVFIGGAHQGCVDYGGVFMAKSGQIRYFTNTPADTIEHEVAHVRHFWLDRTGSDFTAKWRSIGCTYGVSIKNEFGTFVYKDSPSSKAGGFEGPLHGFAHPYGATNLYEDVATFVEALQNKERAIIIFSSIKGDFDIYRQKAELLKQYGFITSEDAQIALTNIAHAEMGTGMLGEMNLGAAGAKENQPKIVRTLMDLFQKKEYQKLKGIIAVMRAREHDKGIKDIIYFFQGLAGFYSAANAEGKARAAAYMDLARDEAKGDLDFQEKAIEWCAFFMGDAKMPSKYPQKILKLIAEK